MAARRRTTAGVAPVPVRGSVPDLRQLTPSARSLVVGIVLALLAVGAYFGARNTSVFAVQTLDVRGGTPELRQQVRDALAGELGTSLLRVNSGVVASHVDPIPGVRSFTSTARSPTRFASTVSVRCRSSSSGRCPAAPRSSSVRAAG